MPEPVQPRRLSSALSRFAGVQGHYGLTLLDDITPVMLVHRDADATLDWLRGERRFGLGLNQPAVVGQFGFMALENPANSNVLVALELLSTFSGNAGAALTAGLGVLGAGGGAAVLTSIPLDSREDPSLTLISAAAYVRRGTNPAAFGIAPSLRLTGVMLHTPLRVVLGPGVCFFVEDQLANDALNVSFTWVERTLLQTEQATG